MQRYRHYGASTPSATSLAAPAEEPHSTEEALNDHEQVCEEQVEPIVSEEAQDGLKKTGGDILEEAAATQQAPLFSEAKPPESKSGKKAAAGGDVGGGAKYSVFTWFAVLALLGVWSSVAVVYFDIVDYDSVVGKLTAYDTDGDGDFDVEDAKVLLDGKRLKASRRRQAYRKVRREMDEDPDEMEVNEDEIPAETTLRKNETRELPIRDDALRSALQEELSAIHEKTEAKRIARVALAEIKAFLADEDRGRETAWELKMKTLEVTQEQLKLQKERIAVETERMEVEKKRMEVERERLEWERAEKERMEREEAGREKKEREKAEKEKTEREKAERERMEREKAEQAKLALQKAKQEQEQLEKKERERLVWEQEATKERERLAAEKSERERKERERLQKEQMAKERERMEKEKLEQEREKAEREEKASAEKEVLAKERTRLAQEKAEKEKAAREKELRLAREKAAREKAEPERPEARKANGTQTPEEKIQRAGVPTVKREKGVVADKMAASGRKK